MFFSRSFIFQKRILTILSQFSIITIVNYQFNNSYINSYNQSELITINDSKENKNELIISKYQPDLNIYEHINVNKYPIYKSFLKNHAIYDTLKGVNKIEIYEVYKHKTKNEIYCIIKFGNAVNGFPKVIHGGISALLIDNSYGCLFFSMNLPPAVTANLNINYRNPIPENSICILTAQLDKIDGRKLLMNAKIEDAVTKQLKVESTTLFVTMKTYDQWRIWISRYFS